MEIYFNEPRFKLNLAGDFLVKASSYAGYTIAASASVVAILSGASSGEFYITSFGLILALFLGDRLIHIKDGEENIHELLEGKNINAALAFSPDAYKVVNQSIRRCFVTRESFFPVLLEELSSNRDIRVSLERLGVDYQEFVSKMESLKNKSPEENKSTILMKTEEVGVKSFELAADAGETFVYPRNIFAALFHIKDPTLEKIFSFFEITPADARESVTFGRFRKKIAGLKRVPAVLGGFAHKAGIAKKNRIMNRAWTARPTPTLDAFGTDFTEMARSENVGFMIGHKKEFENLLDIVSRPGSPNTLLVGRPGSGKSSIIAHLAFRMVKDMVPPVLFDKRLVELSVSDLVADASSEEVGERLQRIVNEVLSAGNVVIFVPVIHDFFRTSGNKSLNAIDVLMPILKSGFVPFIASTHPREFKEIIEPRSDFLKNFEVVKVEEISPEEAVRFLVYYSLVLESQHKVVITFQAIKKSVEIASRYFKQKPLPSSAVEILKQALASAAREGGKVDENRVIDVSERQIKIPIRKAGEEEAKKLLNFEEIVHKKLVNQEMAVKAVATALQEYRSGLARKGGPIATFLFVGPTGVGKTKLAKIISDIQFGDEKYMIRLDMTEYQEKSSISRLIGDPKTSQRGTITDPVMESPYSVILLDEFEKAHPDILNLFLQVFDDGRLTDGFGQVVNFEDVIIIATSNAHSDFIKSEIEKGESVENISDEIKKKLSSYFRPELINRFSDIIVFRDLSEQEISKIAEILMREAAEDLKESNGMILNFDKSAIEEIAKLGYDPVFGARPLRRVISEKVRGVLAQKILRNEVKKGDVINLVYEKDVFDFKIENQL